MTAYGISPYYADDSVTLWHGDCREIVPALDLRPDCVIADPPWSSRLGRETNCEWDIWPGGWLQAMASVTSALWCFGSLRTFGDRWAEFQAAWTFSHEVVWEKQQGTGLRDDRFRRVHELAAHWYRGAWADVYHQVPRDAHLGPRRADTRSTTKSAPGHYAEGRRTLEYADDGSRIARSVVRVRNMHGRALHPTEKPTGLLQPLIDYACPPGGLVLDPFAGSGSTAVAARMSGRRALLVEADERYCEVIARRLAQDVLPIGGGL